MHPPNQPGTRSNQIAGGSASNRGTVLVIGLIILMIMTILGLAGMRTSVLEELMAGQSKDQNGAFQGAEAGIQAALSYLAAQRVPPVVDAQGSGSVWPACQVADADPAAGKKDCYSSTSFDPCCFLSTTIDAWQQYLDSKTVTSLVGGNRCPRGSPMTRIDSDNQPHFVIESRYIAPLDFEDAAKHKGYHYYTVAAIGLDASTKSRAIIQSTVTKLYP